MTEDVIYCQYKMPIQHFIDAISRRRRCVMPGLSVPAPSLSGRPASLRALPDRSPTRFPKRLICMVLPVIARAVCGLRSNFLPELREALQPGRRVEAAAKLPERGDDLAIGRFGKGLQGLRPHSSERPKDQSEPGDHGI